MEKKPLKFNMFHANLDEVAKWSELPKADFEPATKAEKESMVEMHAGVSYWKDARRRFRRNTVSMVALFVFLLTVVFAFVGPYLIPYSYESQYRNSMKLGPLEYSEGELIAIDALETADAVLSTSLRPGSLTAVKKGTYCFKYKGQWIVFTLEATARDSLLIYDADAETPLTVVEEEGYRDAPVSYGVAVTVAEGKPAESEAAELDFVTGVFPHFFGTDSAGRDIMARCMYGARVSILIGIMASLIVLIIGALYGSVSGLCGGAVDFIMMRIVEIMYSIPDVLVVLLLQVVLQTPLQRWLDHVASGPLAGISSLGTGVISIFITFALIYWVGMSRIVRGQVLMLKQQEYVTAATALGASNSRIIRRHLLPNCIGQLVVATCLQIPSAIFLESFLSFLGLGISAPMSSLGSLCSEAIDVITMYPYRLLCPAIILSLVVLSLNLVGDGLRDALDPRLKK